MREQNFFALCSKNEILQVDLFVIAKQKDSSMITEFQQLPRNVSIIR